MDTPTPHQGAASYGVFSAAILLATALALCNLSCKKSPAFHPTVAPADLRASCNNRQPLSTCTDLTARSLAAGEKFARSPCDVTHGLFTSGPCPADALVGSCEIDGKEVRRFYSDGPNPFEPARAKRECEVALGHWIDPGQR